MQCLDCGAFSPDDKRFCSDCGAPLDGDLREVKRYLDNNLRRAIRTSLKEELRDQKVVEVETTEAIVEKLAAWAKLFAFSVGIPIAIVVVVLGIFGIKTYSDFSKLIQNETANISGTLKDAQKQASDLKQQADTIQTEYRTLQERLKDTRELAARVDEVTNKVDTIQEQIIRLAPSAKSTPELEHTLRELRSFQTYLLKLGFKLHNLEPMEVDTRDKFASGAVAEFDAETNTMLLKNDHRGDVTLALSSYAGSVISAQQNLKKKVSYSWEEGVPYYAAEFGLTAYLTCSFLNNPDFTYRRVNLSGTKEKLSAIRYAEDGYAVWGALFWDIRGLLQMTQADKLIVSAWWAVEPPPNPRDFPKLAAKRLLDTYKSSTDGKDFDQLLAILRSRGFDM